MEKGLIATYLAKKIDILHAFLIITSDFVIFQRRNFVWKVLPPTACHLIVGIMYLPYSLLIHSLIIRPRGIFY